MKKFSILLANFVLSSCFLFGSHSQIEELIGKEFFDILSHPSQVVYLCQEKEIQIPLGSVEKLQKCLFNDQGYFFDRKKKCLFIPQGTFVFIKNPEERATLVISLVCKQIKFVGYDRVVFIDIDPMIIEIQQFLDELKL